MQNKPTLAIQMKIKANDFQPGFTVDDYIAGQRAIADTTGFITAVFNVDKGVIAVYYRYNPKEKGELVKGQKLVWVY